MLTGVVAIWGLQEVFWEEINENPADKSVSMSFLKSNG